MTVLDHRRVSTNDAYLEPARRRRNLVIRGDAFVSKIVFRGDKAKGVIVHSAGQDYLEEADAVILCAGALQTPALLCRSGVGPADVVRALGASVLADLPVRRNLAEHPLIAALFPLTDAPGGGNDRVRQGCWLLRTGSEPGRADLHLVAINVSPAGPRIGLIFVALMRCTSRGSVVPNPDGSSSIRFEALSTESDIAAMESGVDRMREVLSTQAVRALSPTPLDLTGRPFELPSTRHELVQWMRLTCLPYRHVAGTCRMGDDQSSVVDGRYRVRGFENLFVADASILPDATSSNTNLTVIALAERAAAMLS
jgi:choline dehydrogenase-like flavoprotein